MARLKINITIRKADVHTYIYIFLFSNGNTLNGRIRENLADKFETYTERYFCFAWQAVSISS